jgi:hypothetical protein
MLIGEAHALIQSTDHMYEHSAFPASYSLISFLSVSAPDVRSSLSGVIPQEAQYAQYPL